jgi:hypothetical protein
MNLEELFHRYKEHSHGRYITLDSIVPILEKLANQLKVIGNRF